MRPDHDRHGEGRRNRDADRDRNAARQAGDVGVGDGCRNRRRDFIAVAGEIQAARLQQRRIAHRRLRAGRNGTSSQHHQGHRQQRGKNAPRPARLSRSTRSRKTYAIHRSNPPSLLTALALFLATAEASRFLKAMDGLRREQLETRKLGFIYLSEWAIRQRIAAYAAAHSGSQHVGTQFPHSALLSIRLRRLSVHARCV